MSSISSDNAAVGDRREFDVASPLAVILKDVIDWTGVHRRRFGDEPAVGSPADLETKNLDGLMTEQKKLDIESTYQEAGGICILSAGYLFSALAQLFRPDMALFGFQVVARAIVETSAKAWWLVDPSASTDTRLARLYVEKLTNIIEMSKVSRLRDSEPNAIERRKQELIEKARESGIAPKFDRNGKLNGFGNLSAPSSTDVTGSFFASLGFEHGKFWYRSLSAICHGTAYGLLDCYSMVDVPGSDLKALVPNLSIEEVVHVAILSMQAYMGAIEFDSRLMGWDADDVERQRQAFLKRMLAVMPT